MADKKFPDINAIFADLKDEMKLPPRKGEPRYEEYIEKQKNKAPWDGGGKESPAWYCRAEYWFPVTQKFAPVPRTIIVPVKYDLTFLCDGITPKGYNELLEELGKACDEIGWPPFIRASETSNKHSWKDTCGGCKSRDDLPRIVYMLMEYSAIADYPMTCFMVREMLPTKPIFHAFDGMPVTREFRLFAKDGEITHVQPYWPEDVLIRRDADNKETGLLYINESNIPDWRDRLNLMSVLSMEEYAMLAGMSKKISKELPLPQGGWSVDWLQDANGKWWLTDMAVEVSSYRWKPTFNVIDDEKRELALKKGIIPEISEPATGPAM